MADKPVINKQTGKAFYTPKEYKVYNSRVNLTFNKATGLLGLVKAGDDGKFDASNAEELLVAAVAYAESNPKASFNKWDFYIPNVNETLDKEDKSLPLQMVKDALKRGEKPFLEVGRRFGKPVLKIAGEITLADGSSGSTGNIVTL